MIRLTRKRLIVTAVVLFVLGSGLWITWEVCDWPPVRLIVKYGFPPAGGPTGRRVVVEGIEFVELEPGYCHVRCRVYKNRPSPLSALFHKVGIRFGQVAQKSPHYVDEWIESATRLWVSKMPVRTITERGRRSDLALESPNVVISTSAPPEAGIRTAKPAETIYAVACGQIEAAITLNAYSFWSEADWSPMIMKFAVIPELLDFDGLHDDLMTLVLQRMEDVGLTSARRRDPDVSVRPTPVESGGAVPKIEYDAVGAVLVLERAHSIE